MIIIIMGVSGSGKSTIGKMLAESLHWQFSDADSFHSPENIEKMQCGIPLSDADRIPWLQVLQTAIKNWLQENKNVVLACSALKASYRQFLLSDNNQLHPNPGDRIQLVYLQGSFDTIHNRLQARQNHFMTAKLLKSQLDTLEEPSDAIHLDISEPPAIIVQKIRNCLAI
ncbi:MAG: gluconokinase [Goleter apudmare HA4340-LM2]|jgi:gluconokinase|nr:gluconokinase [Goleter apudmare HA4340-LM2]